jgi:hypothetical protein
MSKENSYDRSKPLAFLATEKIVFEGHPDYKEKISAAAVPGARRLEPIGEPVGAASFGTGETGPSPAKPAAPAPKASEPVKTGAVPVAGTKQESLPHEAEGVPYKKEAAASFTPGTAEKPEKGRGKLFVIGGICVFGVVIAGLLLSSFIRHGNTASPVAAVQTQNRTPAEMPSVPGNPDLGDSEQNGRSLPQQGKLTAKQQDAMLNEAFTRLPDQLAGQGKQMNPDPFFLAAIKDPKNTEAVFTDSSIKITVFLPDPAKLQSLNIPPYVPRSGAQDYIKGTYEKLVSQLNSAQDKVRLDFEMQYQIGANGDSSYDITMPMLSFPLSDYSEAFKPHMEKYLTDLGFYTAAAEILMPDFQDWEQHKGTEKGAAYLDRYFGDLAAALSDKGINYHNKLTIDADQIKKILSTRFADTWMFENMSFSTNFYGPVLSFDFPNDFSYFNTVTETLNAQYQAGKLKAPATPEEAEALYTAETRKHANALLADLPQARKDGMLHGDFKLDWELLGAKGIAACPELVEDIRQFINGYDFQMIFLVQELKAE